MFIHTVCRIVIIITMRGENVVAHLDGLGGTPVCRGTLVAHHCSIVNLYFMLLKVLHVTAWRGKMFSAAISRYEMRDSATRIAMLVCEITHSCDFTTVLLRYCIYWAEYFNVPGCTARFLLNVLHRQRANGEKTVAFVFTDNWNGLLLCMQTSCHS
jgi:hypothetical protein